ncbi:histidine kinase [Virgibacillus soli]|uniref:histidine kinase n=1 Tax=Paracerasibacillus soli TaxID=480284 RepID=UPI0035EBFFFE
MRNWYHIFPKNTGLSLYAWIIFCILPFYFIFRSSSPLEVVFGMMMIVLFFVTYRLSFIKRGWTVYVSVGIEMAISIGMTLYFGYVYFSLFLAFFIGNIQHRSGFITIYIVHLVTTIAAVTAGFFIQSEIFVTQLPFIMITVIGVILIPVNLHDRNKREQLENQLENANKKISQLIVIEERERIARDLHDTLGQKLSLIGLKSDLAGKLLERNVDAAKNEIQDIHQTARTALKEVRDMVSDMRSAKLADEIVRVRQVIRAAEMDFQLIGNPNLSDTTPMVENVLSMCLKEAVTNIVKHSNATVCRVVIKQIPDKIMLNVCDNGKGTSEKINLFSGNGIRGIKERLEFVNGKLKIDVEKGTTLRIQVPNVLKGNPPLTGQAPSVREVKR